jgi:L-Ala-D/L-Glu epimerase
MRVSHEIVALRTRHPFVIARGGAPDHRVVWVTVTDADGATGTGEAAPNRFYGETPETVVAALARYAPLLADADPWDLEGTEAALAAALRFNPSARSAISAALHDLAAKRLGVPLYRLWGLSPARIPRSSFTIGIVDDEALLRARIAEAAGYPILKIKLGGARDEWVMRVVRDAAPDRILRVDANAGWTVKRAVRMCALLEDYGVELVEQPVAAQDTEGLRHVRERSRLPIVADESCLTASDVPRLAGAVDGVNLKLAKCGGLREALRIVAAARAHGLLVMAGCMVESSLGITAAAHLAPLLDYADLDGAALLADDPMDGATIAGGELRLPERPGLGVVRRGG